MVKREKGSKNGCVMKGDERGGRGVQKESK